MTTPTGSPTGSMPARPRGFQHEDAATQAAAGGGSATVLGVDQDSSPTGAADAAGMQAKLQSGMANPPGMSNFNTDDPDDGFHDGPT